jgi:hypothetical protein
MGGKMNPRDEIREAVESQNKTVYFKIRTGIMRNKKIKFIIRPIMEMDLVSKEILQEALVEMGKGQTIDDAARIAADNYKKKFMSLDRNSACRVIIETGVVFPKIVDKEKDLTENEVPFSYLTAGMKVFLLNKLTLISPMFQR